MDPSVRDVFDGTATTYDAWYDRHPELYAAELDAVGRAMAPRASWSAPGLEVGVGSARFARPLGIGFGVDSAPAMAALANRRGCRTVVADAARLPFADRTFGWSAFLTALCFVPDPLQALREAWRVTRAGGFVVVAFLNRLSTEGRVLEARKQEDRYFAAASFFSPQELERVLRRAGFAPEAGWQVVGTDGTYEVVAGTDRGLYCVVRAHRVDRSD